MFGKILDEIIEPLFEPIKTRIGEPIKTRISNLSSRTKVGILVCACVAATAWASVQYYDVVESRILFAYRYIDVAISPNRIPVPERTRQALIEKGMQLTIALRSALDGPERQAWTHAQIIVALKNHPTARGETIDPINASALFTATQGPGCTCWKKYPQPQYPSHLAISAWVTWAFSALSIVDPRAIEFLLSNQNADGSWPMFASAIEQRYSSTYATALAVIAANEQMKLATDTKLQIPLKRSVQSGMSWLIGHADLNKARWTDYPAWPDARKQQGFIGISGLVLHALHRVGAPNLVELDRAWLAHVPKDVPLAYHGEASNKTITIEPGALNYTDDVRHYGLPWTIIATVDAYPNGRWQERSVAAEWFQRAVMPGSSLYDVSGANDDEWIGAELLLAVGQHEARTKRQ